MNKKLFGLSIMFFCICVGLCAWSNPLNIRIGSPDPYLAIRSGPSISANASGTYTYYIRENDTTVPSHPDPVSMTISGTAMGLGWIDFKITAITINGANHLEDPQYGEAPTEDIGYMAVVGAFPFTLAQKTTTSRLLSRKPLLGVQRLAPTIGVRADRHSENWQGGMGGSGLFIMIPLIRHTHIPRRMMGAGL